MTKHTENIALIILDGWGIGMRKEVDAIAQAHTPFYDQLMTHYPSSTLVTYGTAVGLPKGQMGNSEVGHLNIGAGRVVFQELLRIHNAVQDNSITENEVIKKAFRQAADKNQRVHFIGLLSDGGVHSHINHLFKLIDIAESYDLNNIYIHAFMDGRDVGPKTGHDYLKNTLDYIKNKKVELATVTGRYYAMDRDKRWERTEIAYNALVQGKGETSDDLLKSLSDRYHKDETDEFTKPIIHNGIDGRIQNGDAVICFNFRTDRPRQIIDALSLQNEYGDIKLPALDIDVVTMTAYDNRFTHAEVIFKKENLQQTIGEVIAIAGLKQLRAAETEKYPHVTFFMNGGREEPFQHEHRIMEQSPDVATYDLQPEMSAYPLTEKVKSFITEESPNFIALNYANTDMVGHTGDQNAAQKAAEAVDGCLSTLVPFLLQSDYEIIIIADHGNADIMKTESGKPHTAHTTNLVPILFLSSDKTISIDNGSLCDIAPTILNRLGVEIPEEMTGSILTGHEK